MSDTFFEPSIFHRKRFLDLNSDDLMKYLADIIKEITAGDTVDSRFIGFLDEIRKNPADLAQIKIELLDGPSKGSSDDSVWGKIQDSRPRNSLWNRLKLFNESTLHFAYSQDGVQKEFKLKEVPHDAQLQVVLQRLCGDLNLDLEFSNDTLQKGGGLVDKILALDSTLGISSDQPIELKIKSLQAPTIDANLLATLEKLDIHPDTLDTLSFPDLCISATTFPGRGFGGVEVATHSMSEGGISNSEFPYLLADQLPLPSGANESGPLLKEGRLLSSAPDLLKLFLSRSLMVIYGPFASGKTRTLLETCCLEYGLYFVASRKGNGGSEDIEGLLKLLESYQSEIFTGDRAFNSRIVEHLVWGLVYCRLALLGHLVSAKKVSSPREWLHIQLNPASYLGKDYFALSYRNGASIKDVKRKSLDLLDKYKVKIFLDEAQVLLYKFPQCFKSLQALDGRSLLSAFCRPLTVEAQKIGLAGTTLSFEAVAQDLVSQGLKEGVGPRFNQFVSYTPEKAWKYAQPYLSPGGVNLEQFKKDIYPWLFGRHRFLARYCAEYLFYGNDVSKAMDRMFFFTQEGSKLLGDSLFKLFLMRPDEADLLVTYAMDYLVYGKAPKMIAFPDVTLEESLQDIDREAQKQSLNNEEGDTKKPKVSDEGKRKGEKGIEGPRTKAPKGEKEKEKEKEKDNERKWTAANSKEQRLSFLIRTGFFRLDPLGKGFWFDEPLILLTFVNRLLFTNPVTDDLLEILLDKLEGSVASQQGAVFEQIASLGLVKALGGEDNSLRESVENQIKLIQKANIAEILGPITPKELVERNNNNSKKEESAPVIDGDLTLPPNDDWFFVPLGTNEKPYELAFPKLAGFRIFGNQTTMDFITKPNCIFNHPPDLEGPDQQFWLRTPEEKKFVLIQIGTKFQKEIKDNQAYLVAKVRPEYLHIYKKNKDTSIYRDPQWDSVCEKVANFFATTGIPTVSVIFGYPKEFSPKANVKELALWIGKTEAKAFMSQNILARLDRVKID